MSEELVTTVSLRCPIRARARKLVVVPVSSITESPSRIVLATYLAMAFLATAFSRMRRSKGASPSCPARPTAPWMRTTEPDSTSGRTSRRMVSVETPSWRAMAAMDALPCNSNSLRISPCRLETMSHLCLGNLMPQIRARTRQKTTKPD